MFLVGVFLGRAPAPDGSGLHPGSIYGQRENFKVLSPRTSDVLVGARKRAVRVPARATRLFLGFAKASQTRAPRFCCFEGRLGYYSFNRGSLKSPVQGDDEVGQSQAQTRSSRRYISEPGNADIGQPAATMTGGRLPRRRPSAGSDTQLSLSGFVRSGAMSGMSVGEGVTPWRKGSYALRDASPAKAADENQRRVEGVFAELAEPKPDSVSYIVLLLVDDSLCTCRSRTTAMTK